jgi:hypothetical protein
MYAARPGQLSRPHVADVPFTGWLPEIVTQDHTLPPTYQQQRIPGCLLARQPAVFNPTDPPCIPASRNHGHLDLHHLLLLEPDTVQLRRRHYSGRLTRPLSHLRHQAATFAPGALPPKAAPSATVRRVLPRLRPCMPALHLPQPPLSPQLRALRRVSTHRHS